MSNILYIINFVCFIKIGIRELDFNFLFYYTVASILGILLYLYKCWRRQWHPTPVLLPRKSMDGGAWWVSVHGAAQSRQDWSDLAVAAASNREGTQPRPSTENWIKDLLNITPPIRTRPSFPLSQSLPSGSFHKLLILIHQRADRMKTTITEN